MKNERRSQIKAYISEHKSARIEDLAKQNPDVSLMTLRRDLAALEEEGFLVRVRGGAYTRSDTGPDARQKRPGTVVRLVNVCAACRRL